MNAGGPKIALSWQEKVLAIHAALGERDVPHAFGGAIALNYHREPRTTLDIDINIFLTPTGPAAVLAALGELYAVGAQGKVERELRDQGQARTQWSGTYVDLFFSNTPFHEAMAERSTVEVFGDTRIPVISIEDLLVCKVLFDRGRDWVDIDAVVRTEGRNLDVSYIEGWLDKFLAPDDPRIARLQELRVEAAEK
jgi:hypothetical protein